MQANSVADIAQNLTKPHSMQAGYLDAAMNVSTYRSMQQPQKNTVALWWCQDHVTSYGGACCRE